MSLPRFSPARAVPPFACAVLFATCASVPETWQAAAAAGQAPTAKVAIQPVEEYFVPFDIEPKGNRPGLTPRERVTHLGTDFGFMGPGRHQVVWRDGMACADLRDAQWAGMWHSLAGLGREADKTLDFQSCFAPWIVAAKQPRCTGVIVRVGGNGQFRIEIKSADDKIAWQWQQTINEAEPREITIDCPTDKLRAAKYITWVAYPGANISVDRLALRIEFPPMTTADRAFLVSYAKLSRSYDANVGVVKNRAHWPTGAFDAVPASGLFALATATAWTRGVVDRSFAERVLHDVHKVMSKVPRAHGWLPHFVSRDPVTSWYTIHPDTEYSDVDSSLYFHGMILAAQILDDKGMLDALEKEVKALTFESLRDADGWLNHGFRMDGETLLRGVWNGWGGETALTLLIERMALGENAPLKMNPVGHVHNGVGFIAEIEGLFYPQFDDARPDAVSHINWRASRLALLAAQQAYYPKVQPYSAAARLGLFGLSAGEGYRGRGYIANGTEKVRVDLIHPHYVFMAGRWQPAQTLALVEKLESAGLFPPWGLVENVQPDLAEYLPFNGSLNAAFEAIGAYHMWSRFAGQPDVIDDACKACPLTANAVRAFYP
jgi:hypothetical protein